MLPSQRLGIKNKLAAFSFDRAVVVYGSTVDAALREEIEIGSGDSKRKIPRYTLQEIFRKGHFLQRGDGNVGDLSLLKKPEGAFYDEVE